MDLQNGTCRTCACAEYVIIHINHDDGAQTLVSDAFFCHLSPPVFINGKWTFPKTNAETFCGQWQLNEHEEIEHCRSIFITDKEAEKLRDYSGIDL